MIYLSSKIVLNVVFAGNFSDDVKRCPYAVRPRRTALAQQKTPHLRRFVFVITG